MLSASPGSAAALFGDLRKGRSVQHLRSELGSLLDVLGNAIIAPEVNPSFVGRVREALLACSSYENLSDDRTLSVMKATLSGALIDIAHRAAGNSLSGPDENQYEYQSERDLAKAYANYQDAFKGGDQDLITKAYTKYREASDAYEKEAPLNEELERLFSNPFGESDKVRAEKYAKMEELRPGWAKAHLDWIVYERTGGQPDWYITLKEKGASVLDQVLMVLPFLPAAKGARVSMPRLGPRVPLPRVSIPRVPSGGAAPPRPAVMTPGGTSKFQPLYPLAPKPPSRPPVATPSPSLVPGRPPSGLTPWGAPTMTPSGGSGTGKGQTPASEFTKAFERILPGRPPVATPSGGSKPPVGYIRLSPAEESALMKSGLTVLMRPNPATGETFYHEAQTREVLRDLEKGMVPTPPPVATPSGRSMTTVVKPPEGFSLPPKGIVLPGNHDAWVDPVSGKTYYRTYEIQDYIRNYAPSFWAPMPNKLTPRFTQPLEPGARATPPAPLPFVPSIDTRTSMAPPSTETHGGMTSQPAPVATTSAGSNRCPPGQFWDGRQCRGSVSAMPNIPGMLPGGGGGAQATSLPGGLTMGMAALLGECRKGCSQRAQGLRSELGVLLNELGSAIVAPGSNPSSVGRLREALSACAAYENLTDEHALARMKETLSKAILEARRLRASGATMAGPFRVGPSLLGATGTSTATRPSCLECVEKHLGAAWVLVTETRNGYPHRTMAVGHLHEAEDESQEFPELHNAVRDARKHYQSDETMPDWTKLRLLLERARKAS